MVYFSLYPAFSSEVQFGQRVALIGIAEKQYAHSFVAGATGGASSSRLILLMVRTRRNTAKAIRMKLMIVLMNTPKLIVTAPADFAAATEA
jgi:pyrroloquinoline quinone (PQQ) biosynthesis protein C